MVAAQVIFAVNFIYSMFRGPVAGRNPWNANTLEWTAPSPPGHGNFDFQPVVYRGPYEYSRAWMREGSSHADRSPESGRGCGAGGRTTAWLASARSTGCIWWPACSWR